MQRFLQKFKRITYSTSYLPEVDGLRFLAIFLVVVVMHIPNYINETFYNRRLIPEGYWRNFMFAGGHGVDLFFVISGFILSLPFAKWRLNNGNKVSLKNYYLRRLTRLEPPYIIALIIFFIAHVWLLHKYSFSELLPHFFASTVYLHNTIYNSFSWVLPVAWSLEVEVQFYILAPLFFLIFRIPSHTIRRIIFLLIIIAGNYFSFDYWGIGNVFVFIRVFFIGLLLSDLYCTQTILFKNHSVSLWIGLLTLAGLFFIPSLYFDSAGLHYGWGYLVKLVCIFLLFHCALNNTFLRKIFSGDVIIIIGGMCYSIYLMHFAIISAAGSLFLKTGIQLTSRVYLLVFFLVLLSLVLLISSVYFFFVEKPFMRPFTFLKKPK